MHFIHDGPISARFMVNLRCHNCSKLTSNIVDVPDVDDAPTCSDELVESAYVASLPFRCERCDNPSGIIVAVARVENDDVAA